MDLGGDSSESTHLNENDDTLEGTSSNDGIKLENNGSCANEILDLGSVERAGVKTSAEVNGKEIGTETPVRSPSEVAETSPGVSGETPPVRKGYGLKKWRRIRRDFTKDESSGVDLNRILKRGPPNAAELLKSRNPTDEIKQKSEDSAASAESSVKSPDLLDGFAIKGSSLDSTLGVGSAFAVGTDSENSGDRSSKSSTAASAPRMRNDAHIMGSVRDKHRVKNPSGRSSSNAVQKVQQVKGRIETGKKFRGERVKIEKENSYSSIESDLRSSNVVFTQTGSVYGTSKARQSEMYSNYDEENSDKGQTSDLRTREGDRKYCEENGGDIEDVSQNDVSAGVSLEEKGEEIESHRVHADWDPLVKSIISLQAVQEALETEIAKFGELGKEPVSPFDDDCIQSQSLPVDFVSSDPKTDKPNSCSYLHSDETDRNCFRPLEAQLIDLNQKVNHLEHKLEETSAMLKVKESRVVELEDILNRRGLQKEEESGSTLPFLQDKCKEMEAQLEDLLKLKIEAEIEYLLISRTTEKLKVDSEDQISLFEEQKSLSMKQNQMLQRLRDAESKASVLKRHADELDASCEEILGTEEVLKMQNRPSGVVPT
ncbi:hypothetical protein BVC80_1501g2 [Macleaya cordata]|uniref:Uncharacterized protein n=1 Tax=Macleaya cordata TaxID=56857 RepID=A0A200Q105_MACCD|nr:hypothetical protein BVC80_1501g2 [Macleaya cordata]